MKLTKGKINRIINKKNNSKNIKKRKYKRTDTCNNKAKRHLANRTLKCYKSKKPNKKLSQIDDNKPYDTRSVSIGGAPAADNSTLRIKDRVNIELNKHIIKNKELNDIRSEIEKVNQLYSKYPNMVRNSNMMPNRGDEISKNVELNDNPNIHQQSLKNDLNIHKQVLKKIDDDKKKSNSSSCYIDSSITFLKITSKIIEDIEEKGYITLKMTSKSGEETLFNIREQKFSLKLNSFLIVEPPNADAERVAFDTLQKDKLIKTLRKRLENRSDSFSLCSLLKGEIT